MAPGSLGDPILISDSPPHISYNDADHHPRQGFAHSGHPRPAPAPLPASGLRPGHRDSMIDEYGRTIPRPISRPIIPPIPPPVPPHLTEQYKAPRGINPYLDGRATDRRLPLQTLPYNVKHSILQEIQKILEGALYDWAKEWAPVMLNMAGWETAEAGELNWWWRTIESYSKRANLIGGADHNVRPISVDAFSRSAGMNMRELQQLLGRRLPHIRHAAVHRDPSITVSALKEMLADAHYLTKGLRDGPRTQKLYAMQLALEANDIKWMDAMMATAVSEFTVDFDPKKFRTQPSTLEQENTRPGDLKRKRSESPAEKVSRHRAEVIKHSGQSMDLTKDSNDDDPPSSNPAKPTRVIDLTGEEVVILFSSTRGTKALEQ